MSYTVLFLLPAGIFMLFDHAVNIVINCGTGGESGLDTSVHGQLIYIETRGPVIYELPFAFHIPDHGRGFFIYFLSVHILSDRELGLCAVDAQEGVVISFHSLSRFFFGIHVIRKSRNF